MKWREDGKDVRTNYTYDAKGNLTQVTDPTGITTFAYDRFGRQTGKSVPGSANLVHEYDRNGNLTKYTDGGGSVTYAYNQVNLLTSLLEPGAATAVTFTYDENNRRRFMYLPTSPRITVEMKYDKSGRQTSITATNDSTAAKLSSFTYNYSKVVNGVTVDTAQRQKVTDLNGTTTYSYDKLNRFTGASGALSRSYDYDENFNRTSKTESGSTTSYSYNNAHQLTSAGSTTYSYDTNGNTTGSSSGWAFSYNSVNNQTTSITKPGGTALAPLAYGGADQTERRGAGSTTYVTSTLGVASARTPAGVSSTVTANSTDPAPGTTDHYTRDNSGSLIGMRANGVRYYYLVDGLGSVVGVVNGNATKVNSYSYDPYGNQLSASQQVSNPWRYAAGQFDGGTGLTKFGARYYDGGLGRFTQRDPSGKDFPYTYAGGDPVKNVDPSGHGFLEFAVGGLVGAAALVLFSAAGAPLAGAFAAGCAAAGIESYLSGEGAGMALAKCAGGGLLGLGGGWAAGKVGGIFASKV
ncbi:RHS repeat-associated core domain-containing protein [Micromonospora sp. DT31]|uniref:RHS repeat-associated core domain-containing protein n=1 Tax=Micromonospora sp. DT31 TaxID=3393434 RepID=UPI003CF43AF0